MLSLSNVFDKEDIINFEKKIKNYLNLKKINFLSTQSNQKLMEYLRL